jgi:hypothetical protein
MCSNAFSRSCISGSTKLGLGCLSVGILRMGILRRGILRMLGKMYAHSTRVEWEPASKERMPNRCNTPSILVLTRFQV